MSKTISPLLLGAALLLASCGARVTPTETANAAGTKADLVIVESDVGIAARDAAYTDAVAAVGELEGLVVTELAKKGIAATTKGSMSGQTRFGAPGTALLALSVAKAEQGSTAKRLLVGFGYGKSELEVNAQLLAPTNETRQVIAGFRTNAGSGYKPGLVMPLGVGAAVGGSVAVSSGVNLALGIRKTPHRDIRNTAKAIAKTAAEALEKPADG